MDAELVRRAEALGLKVTAAYLVDLWDEDGIHLFGGDFGDEAEAERWLAGRLDTEEARRQPRAGEKGEAM